MRALHDRRVRPELEKVLCRIEADSERFRQIHFLVPVLVPVAEKIFRKSLRWKWLKIGGGGRNWTRPAFHKALAINDLNHHCYLNSKDLSALCKG
jgi:hypothetical protein